MKPIAGKNLTPRQKQLVLSAYVHRSTAEHPNLHIAPVRGTDADWVNEHSFYFVKDGSRLSGRHNYAQPAFMADID